VKIKPVVPILAAYVLLALLYSLTIPMFEAPDENYHFAFVQYVAHTGTLPIQIASVDTPYHQEGGQPPLYYLMAAPLVNLANPPYVEYPLAKNPHAQIGIGLAQIDRNTFLHTPAEAFPYQGVFLAFHLVRLLSIVLGAITVWASDRIARRIFPDRPGLAIVATFFVAFNPMFLMISASVNNDNMVTAIGALALWIILVCYQEGITPTRAAILAILLALAGLSKISGLTLYAVAGGLLLLELIQKRTSWRVAIATGIGFIGAFAVIAGWWYLRNLQLYGDLTGLSAFIKIIEPRKTPYTLATFFQEFQGLRISFWGLFGWLNVITPNVYLWLMDALSIGAMVGLAIFLWRTFRSRHWDRLAQVSLLITQIGITFGALINWTRLTPGTQGRLMFPALAPIAILFVLGIDTLLSQAPSRKQSEDRDAPQDSPRSLTLGAVRTGLFFVPMGIVAIAAPILIIGPAYAPPPSVDRLPDTATPIDARSGTIAMRGFQIDSVPVKLGGELSVTLYYSGSPDPRNLSLYLTLLDRDNHPISKIDTQPGGGNLPTSAFVEGKLYADTYTLPLNKSLTSPMQGRIQMGWWDAKTHEYLKATASDGTPVDALVLRGGTLLPDAAPIPSHVQKAIFSGALQLNGYTIDQQKTDGSTALTVTLNWAALTTVHEDFTVFVHLLGADGKIVAQADDAPLHGDYPTSAWAPSQPCDDPHRLIVSQPGTYRLAIGLYRPHDLSRLPVDSGGDTLILDTPIVVP
jgi:hypothetical protein